MERHLISHIAHTDHPIAAPVSGQTVTRILRRAKLGAQPRVLDIGCGHGVWTLRALAMHEDATADAVDVHREGLESCRIMAERQGLDHQLTLHHMPAADYKNGLYDLVMCVGATHAYGGLVETANALKKHLKPGGLALIGEGFWEVPPNAETLITLGAEPGEYADLAGTVERAESAGYATVYAYTSELSEWDDYEWSWTGSLLRWAVDHPGPDGDTARAAALAHRDMWLKGYRGVLGFVTLLLKRTN